MSCEGAPGVAWASRRFFQVGVPGFEVIDPGFDGEEPSRPNWSTGKVACQRSLVRAVRGSRCTSLFRWSGGRGGGRRCGRGRR